MPRWDLTALIARAIIALVVRLDRTARAGADLDPGSRRGPGAQAEGPAPHGERVTISAEGREASRESAPAVRGEVRWYRAARNGLAWRRVAASADPPAARSAARPEANSRPMRSPRLAIAAYARAMREAA